MSETTANTATEHAPDAARPTRILFGMPRFSDTHGWHETARHFPPALAGRVTTEAVEFGGLLDRLREGPPVDVVVPVMATVTEEVFERGVTLVQQFGVGVERIDLAAAGRHRVRVANMPGLNAPFVAERAIALLLSLLHRLPEAASGFREGHWASPSGRSLAGSTGCVIGLGAIGRQVTERLAGFDCRVIGVHRSAPPAGSVPAGVELLPTDRLEDALRRSDWVIVAATHTSGTPPLLTAGLIAALPPTAIIVNVARAAALDNDAAVAALEAGRLDGLGLDVFPIEPYPADGALLAHPRVLATAHTASLTTAYFEAASRRLGDAVDRHRRGEPPLNELTRW